MPNPSPNIPHSPLLCIVAGQDYISTINELLVFNRGDSRVCHRASITKDSLCEVDPAENYFYELSLVNGTLPIHINRSEAEVIIDNEKNGNIVYSRII